MIDEVRRTMRIHDLARPGQPLWVAVSGGIDSMVLLHVLRALGHPCRVVHVDHGLRGAGSDADRDHVVAHCHKEHIPCVVRRVDVGERSVRTGESTQMAARALRLAALKEVTAEGPDLVAFGHHADDALESFFMGLMQGLGAAGWSGVRPRSESFIRPLIGVDRAAIHAYATDQGITWREDPSNRDVAYLRNRVRHALLPQFEQWRPGSQANLVRNMRLLAELDHLARQAGEGAERTISTDQHGVMHIPFATIMNGTPRIVLHRLLRDKGFHPDRLDDIIDAIQDQRTGARFPGITVEVFVDRGELLIAPQSPAPRSWTFPHAEAEHLDAPLRITTSSFNRIVLNAGTSTAWFDVDRIAWPIELRPWRPGDRMRPDGLGGSKLVSDILIDAKVPRSTKERVLVLADTDRILWLCGFRIAADVKATSASTRVLRLDLLGP